MKKDYQKHNASLTPTAKALRRNMTKEERHLWFDFLQSYPVRFLKQKVIENYIVDFYCAKAKLIVELDGSQHFDPKNLQKDEVRSKSFEKYGLTVLRIPNNAIWENFSGVCEYIDFAVKRRIESPGSPLDCHPL